MIYILSTKKLAKKNKYRIGSHNGTLEQLYDYYQTILVDPIVYHSIELEYTVYIESKIRRQLYEYTITNEKGDRSKWVVLDLASIISKIHTILTDHNCKWSHIIELSDKKNLTEAELMFIYMKTSKYTSTKSKKMTPEEKQRLNEKMELKGQVIQVDDSDSIDLDDSVDLDYCDDSDDSINSDGLTSAQNDLSKKIVVDIVNRFVGKNMKEYTPEDLNLINITMTTKKYNKIMADIAENSLYFANESQNRYLFFNNRSIEKKPSSYSENKQYYFDTIQALLDLFAIKLIREKCVRKNKKSSYIYSLYLDPQIRKIADFKYGITDTIDIYSELFKK